jgi:DNA-binding transcriptional regulator YdaS (Cro superfamily)
MGSVSLQTALEQSGMSQHALATRLTVNQSTVSRWVRRRVPAERVIEVAKALRVKPFLLRPDLYPRSAA